ncbi:MAG: RNA polymerase sigma factor [Thermodesulfobacteriota bacterium]|nr:RNA polymerase sigma factor [Thermodesulfobacteriota bacterium]
MFSKSKRNNQRFNKLVYPHVTFLYNMALRYTGNTYDAEDLVQETLHIALKRLSQLRDETKCKSWLFKILRSVFLRELTINERKQKFEFNECNDYAALLKGVAENYDIEKVLERKAKNSQIQQILETLPEKYKSPILLYYMEDLTYQEISEYLRIPIGTVMSRLSRAKVFLKNEIVNILKENSHNGDVVELRKFKKDR